MSTVTVFSTKGKKRSVVETNGVATWGELKGILNSNGIETDNMKAIIGENQVTLESAKAILPLDFNFTLFLTPIKVKNGVVDVSEMGYKECRSFIKENGGAEKFGNYTHMTTAQLQSAIKEFLKVNAVVEEPIVETMDAIALVDKCSENLMELVDNCTDVPDDLVDICIEDLNRLRNALEAGNSEVAVVDPTIELEEKWIEIESNL